MTFSDSDIISMVQSSRNSLESTVFCYIKKNYWKNISVHIKHAYSLSELDLQDLFSDVIATLFDSIRKNIFLGKSSIYTYMSRIAINKAINFKISNRRHENFAIVDFSENFRNIENDPKNSIYDNEPDDFATLLNVEKVALDLINKLREKDRNMLIDFCFGNLSHSQIAKKYGYKSEECAKVKKSRIIKKLMKLLYKTPEFKEYIRNI